MIIDSHCHLNYLKLDGTDLEKVITNAKIAGIDKVVSIACAWHEITDIQKIAETFEDVFFSVGVHPSELDSHQLSVQELVNISKHPKCVAIG